MDDRINISVDWLSDEALNRGPLVLLLRRQYEFLFVVNLVQFPFSYRYIALAQETSRSFSSDGIWTQSLPAIALA